jgi:hypothetical protein
VGKLLDFIRKEVLAVVSIVSGFAVFVYDAVSGVSQFQDWGIPSWGWQIIGATLLTLGVLVIAYRLHQRIEASEARTPPVSQASHPVTPQPVERIMTDPRPALSPPPFRPPAPNPEIVMARPDQVGRPTLTFDYIGSALFAGRVEVETNRLEDDLILTIHVIAFNGSGDALKLSETAGAIRWSPWPSKGEGDLQGLPRPIVTIGGDDNPGFAPYGERMIKIEQRAPKAAAQEMTNAMTAEGLNLDFREFKITLAAPESDDTTQFPLWSAVRVYLAPPRITTGRVTFGSALVNLGGVASNNP